MGKPHYMRGGVPGRIDSLPFDRAAGTSGLWAPKIKFWDPLNFTRARDGERVEEAALHAWRRAGPHRFAAVRPRRWHQRPVGAQDQVLGPAQLHGRALGGAEGPQEEGRAEERPPGDDR